MRALCHWYVVVRVYCILPVLYWCVPHVHVLHVVPAVSSRGRKKVSAAKLSPNNHGGGNYGGIMVLLNQSTYSIPAHIRNYSNSWEIIIWWQKELAEKRFQKWFDARRRATKDFYSWTNTHTQEHWRNIKLHVNSDQKT